MKRVEREAGRVGKYVHPKRYRARREVLTPLGFVESALPIMGREALLA